MLATCELIAFGATVQPERAKDFYQKTLGLSLVADEPWALVFDANGTMLRLQKVPQFTPAPFTSLGWRVNDIHALLQRLAETGVSAERYAHFEQDALGVWSSPGGAKVAWFKDPDGNTLSLTQF